MASVVGTFLLLLMICCLAGYPALRYLGKGLPADQQVVALPLLGSAILALLLQWTHVAAPLSRMTVLGVLIPALVAASLVVFRTLRNRKLTRPGSASILTIAIAIVCVLIPFFKLGRPTSFAIINNDAFFYAAADFLVQHTRYTDTSPPSILARSAARIRRYGIDYLSTVVQATTGLRSWETVQLTGAFGLLLSMAAAYLLTRGLGGNRQAAAIAGIVVGMSHWTFRLYMEAVLAYLFGLAYLIACVWACTLKRIENLPFRNRIAVAGLMLCGLTVFYFDLLPLFLVIAVSGLAAGAICGQKFAFPATAVAALVIVPLPVLHQAISHFLRLSATTGPGKHFNLADVPRTILHFTGTMDVYDYIYWPGSITPIHVAGATAVVVLAGMGIFGLRSSRMALVPALAVVAPMLVLCLYLAHQGRDYHAHRTVCVAAAFAIPVLSAALAEVVSSTLRARMFVVGCTAVALLGVAQGTSRILARFDKQNIIVTDLEKQVGDEWISALDKKAVVLIDVVTDAPAFQSHYLYLESVYGMGGDESRVLLPNVRASYLIAAPPWPSLNLSRATHVLRAHNAPPTVVGPLQAIASNERYELLAVVPGGHLFPRPGSW